MKICPNCVILFCRAAIMPFHFAILQGVFAAGPNGCRCTLSEESTVDEKVNIYLNRLSDYLFTLARKIGNEHKIPENQWIPRV